MKTICPDCRSRIRFSLWRRDAMSLKCPSCHLPVFRKYRIIETFTMLAGLGAFLGLMAFGYLKVKYIPLIIIFMLLVEYVTRLGYVFIHNKIYYNKY